MARERSGLALAVLDELAGQLVDAEDRVAPIEPLGERWPGLTVDDAYLIQARVRATRLARGSKVVGHKIGLTSKAMQEMLGIDQPDYGSLLETQLFSGGAHVPGDRFVAPRVEAEIAFRLAESLSGPDVGVEDVAAATEAVAPSLEIIDSRIRDWRITLVDTIADNASCGAAVVGAWVPVENVSQELGEIEMRLTVDGDTVEGRGDAVLGDPRAAVAWLARALHRHGSALSPGDVVLSGAITRALPIGSGSAARAEFDALGVVEASF